jgi:hypothetical protein
MPLPCPGCGSTGPASVAWEQQPEGRAGEVDRGRLAYRHRDGSTCYPLSTREHYRIPCSSCGAELSFLLLVTPGTFGGGVTDRLACKCGATWKLEQTARVNVYIAAVVR